MNTPVPRRPQTVSELAHRMGVLTSTLWRALRNDPAAPQPADRDHRDRPLYDPQAVADWWPNRRRRGAPTRSTPVRD